MAKKLVTTLERKKDLTDVIFEWISPERYWIPRDRSWYVIYSLFFIVIIVPFVIWEMWIAALATLCFTFLWFIQALTPPHNTNHTITNLGIKTYGKLYKWSEISHYWFSKKGETHYLNLDITSSLYIEEGRKQRVSLIIDENNIDDIFFILVDRIDYGDKEEVNYNILTRILHGVIIPVESFLPEDVLDQESYLGKTRDAKDKLQDQEDED